ncbi:MAG: ABC transporter permease [Anaerolineae bacterium]|nr:ABC transporter permease [Anaerolineae bacterium]
MTTNTQHMDPESQVISLNDDEDVQSRGFWLDAWRRLRRNHLALIGGVIIIVNVVMAIFANYIAPYSFREQNHLAFRSAPGWVISLFPQMKEVDRDIWSFAGQEGDMISIRIESGDFNPLVILQGPDGERLREGKPIMATVGQPSPGDEITRFTLPETGVYTIVAGREVLNESGNYTLIVENDNADSTGESTVECTDTASGGQRDCGSMQYGETATSILSGEGFVVRNNDYLMGTDDRGRDIFSRIIYGARISLSVAIVGSMVSMLVGLTLGLISGYLGGFVENAIMRFVDIMYGFPTLLFIILLMSFFRADVNELDPGTWNYRLYQLDADFGGMLFIFIGVGLTSWMQTARLTRGQVLSLREQEFVVAARSIGTRHRSIIVRHMLPNILGPIIIAETLTIPTYISYEAFLSFIGLGVQRPTPSWGQMISDGAQAINSYPHMALFPALALFMIMFAFNFLGDGLRDALDPHTTN